MTVLMQYDDWLVELLANARMRPRMSLTSYCIPELYASSRIFQMKSMLGFVPG